MPPTASAPRAARDPARLPLTVVARRPVEAVFLERPHRFAARCRLASGEVVEAHLPNPGRLTGTAAPGRRALLDGPYPPGKRKLLWTCLALREPTAWVGTVTTAANRAFPLLLAEGFFPELDGAEPERAEVARGRSRFDWALRDRDGARIWVEVKSATLAEGRRALFPDAVTARGARHLGELAEMARAGERCAVAFVAQRADVRSFEAARSIDPAFADALATAREAGVQILAASLSVGPAGLRPSRRLEVR